MKKQILEHERKFKDRGGETRKRRRLTGGRNNGWSGYEQREHSTDPAK